MENVVKIANDANTQNVKEDKKEGGYNVNLNNNYQDLNSVPDPKVNPSGPLKELLDIPYVVTTGLAIPKKELADFIEAQLTVKANVTWKVMDFNTFHTMLNKTAKADLLFDNGLTALEKERLLKLFYPSNTQGAQVNNALQGLFEVIVRKEDIFNDAKPQDILEYSTMEDPEKFFKSPNMKKFMITGQRQIFYTDLSNNTIHYFIPALLVALSKIGLNPEEAINKNFISLGETLQGNTQGHIQVHIRKDLNK